MENINDFIQRMAHIIRESNEEPSYDDILVLAMNTGKDMDDPSIMAKGEYDALSDDEKEEIFQTAKLSHHIPDDGKLGKWDETDWVQRGATQAVEQAREQLETAKKEGASSEEISKIEDKISRLERIIGRGFKDKDKDEEPMFAYRLKSKEAKDTMTGSQLADEYEKVKQKEAEKEAEKKNSDYLDRYLDSDIDDLDDASYWNRKSSSKWFTYVDYTEKVVKWSDKFYTLNDADGGTDKLIIDVLNKKFNADSDYGIKMPEPSQTLDDYIKKIKTWTEKYMEKIEDENQKKRARNEVSRKAGRDRHEKDEEYEYPGDIVFQIPEETETDESKVETFKTMREAMEFVDKRIDEILSKYSDIKRDDFKTYSYEGIPGVIPGVDKSKKNLSSINNAKASYDDMKIIAKSTGRELMPEDEYAELDDEEKNRLLQMASLFRNNVYGIDCVKTVGEGETRKYKTVTFDKKKYSYLFQFLVYRAPERRDTEQNASQLLNSIITGTHDAD